ncbi:MAG TPA: SAV_6107 family HEPN domain-containing protein [Pseudonocardia sp.]|nr:SAV_6107 family HEPN domain-containing protein [Pseudonocardia sp.]
MPVGPPPSAAALGLLRQAEEGLAEAAGLVEPSRRYATAHLAALRAGAAVLAVRAQPARPRRGGRSVWQLLTLVAPELAEWAAFFAAGSATRAAAEAGITRLVTERAADDLVRQVTQFVEVTRSLVSR